MFSYGYVSYFFLVVLIAKIYESKRENKHREKGAWNKSRESQVPVSRSAYPPGHAEHT